MKTILLCSDLDRTLIPNGDQQESPGARKKFCQLAAHRHLRLAYVTGRHHHLVRDAIKHYALPEPDFVIGDVGTTLYRIRQGQWHLDTGWQREIGRDWGERSRDRLVEVLSVIGGFGLQLQEDEKQNRYKVSYYTDPDLEAEVLRERISALLGEHGIISNIIWSRDEAAQCGLLDILPRRANKLRAIHFLLGIENIPQSRTVFAGDSGNDLDALASGLQAILVKNCAPEVRDAALEELERKGLTHCLYLAQGNWHGMNGNYAAGVLEGLFHFFPETGGWVPPEP